MGAEIVNNFTKNELLDKMNKFRRRLHEEIAKMAATDGETSTSSTKIQDFGGSETAPDYENDYEMEIGSESGGEIGAGEEVEEDEEELPNCGNVNPRLQCQMCNMQVADNPSSIGLHVRHHLNYKPFECALCDFRHCVQVIQFGNSFFDVWNQNFGANFALLFANFGQQKIQNDIRN